MRVRDIQTETNLDDSDRFRSDFEDDERYSQADLEIEDWKMEEENKRTEK